MARRRKKTRRDSDMEWGTIRTGPVAMTTLNSVTTFSSQVTAIRADQLISQPTTVMEFGGAGHAVLVKRIIIKIMIAVGNVVTPGIVEWFWGLFIADTVNGNYTSGVDPLMAGTEDKVADWIYRRRFSFTQRTTQFALEDAVQDPSRSVEINVNCNRWIRAQQAVILTYAWRYVGGSAIDGTAAGDYDMMATIGRKA